MALPEAVKAWHATLLRSSIRAGNKQNSAAKVAAPSCKIICKAKHSARQNTPRAAADRRTGATAIFSAARAVQIDKAILTQKSPSPSSLGSTETVYMRHHRGHSDIPTSRTFTVRCLAVGCGDFRAAFINVCLPPFFVPMLRHADIGR